VKVGKDEYLTIDQTVNEGGKESREFLETHIGSWSVTSSTLCYHRGSYRYLTEKGATWDKLYNRYVGAHFALPAEAKEVIKCLAFKPFRKLVREQAPDLHLSRMDEGDCEKCITARSTLANAASSEHEKYDAARELGLSQQELTAIGLGKK
jgi:hypothetical protein